MSVSLTASIQPHEIPKSMRDHLSDIARRVALAAAVEGNGHDLMLRVYLAGMYHGALAGSAPRPSAPVSYDEEGK